MLDEGGRYRRRGNPAEARGTFQRRRRRRREHSRENLGLTPNANTIREETVIRQFAITWLTFARVENLLVRKANRASCSWRYRVKANAHGNDSVLYRAVEPDPLIAFLRYLFRSAS